MKRILTITILLVAIALSVAPAFAGERCPTAPEQVAALQSKSPGVTVAEMDPGLVPFTNRFIRSRRLWVDADGFVYAIFRDGFVFIPVFEEGACLDLGLVLQGEVLAAFTAELKAFAETREIRLP